MVLLIDNYDSFTFNIVDYLCRAGAEPLVIKNDQYSIEQIKQFNFDKIILSPGPGNPSTAGISLAVMAEFANDYPILGICLGHQIIAQYYGHQIVHAPVPMHGKTDLIYHDQQGLFAQLTSPSLAVRYHSLLVADQGFERSELMVTARNNKGLIMGLRHKHRPIESVQFHPEAIKTEHGLSLIKNFVNFQGKDN